MTPARACGTIRTARMTTTMTKNNTASTTIPPAVIRISSFRDQRRGAVDLQHVHVVTGIDDLFLVVRARTPHLAADLHAPPGAVDALQHRRACTHQRRGAGADVRR